MSTTRAAQGIDLQAASAYLAEQNDVVAAYLFGSVACGKASHLSDVDLAVLLDPQLDTTEAVERQLQLMVALDDFADREVQVTVLNHASPLLAYQVVRERFLIYERSRLERITFEVRAMKVYFDVKSMLEFHSEALLRQIREVGLGRAKRDSRTLETAERIRQRLVGIASR